MSAIVSFSIRVKPSVNLSHLTGSGGQRFAEEQRLLQMANKANEPLFNNGLGSCFLGEDETKARREAESALEEYMADCQDEIHKFEIFREETEVE